MQLNLRGAFEPLVCIPRLGPLFIAMLDSGNILQDGPCRMLAQKNPVGLALMLRLPVRFAACGRARNPGGI